MGPLSFIIYLNKLILSLTITSNVYADDNKPISINNKKKNSQQLIMHENLNFIYAWTVYWKVFLNEIKCKVLHLDLLLRYQWTGSPSFTRLNIINDLVLFNS